jgi:uncharacterized surface protein with fasciclin (FAS1) repeats
MMSKALNLLAAAAMLALPFAAGGVPAAADRKDLIGTVEAAGDFKTLVAAIRASGLEEDLAGPGPWTLFAPTDQAFAKLPAGTVEELLKPENRARLRTVLSYHVVGDEWTGKELAGRTKGLATVQGKELFVKDTGRVMKIDEAAIVAPDLMASNGVVHAIDKVVMPN